MANPRQRRKARSSGYKPVRSTSARSLRKKPPIKGPRLLQDAWDRTKTVRQNYSALGLLADVNERLTDAAVITSSPEEEQPPVAGPSNPRTASPVVRGSQSALARGTGRIIRDEAGNVIGVELPEEDEDMNPNGDDGGEPTGAHAPMLDDREPNPVVPKTAIVAELERTMSAGAGIKKTRHVSMHQTKWLRELMKAHGRDVDAMARDRKLNVWQKTAGQLRRDLKLLGTSSSSGGAVAVVE